MKQKTSNYQEKRSFFDNVMTFYGRNVVVELLQDDMVNIYRVHLADSNRNDDVIKKITALANQRKVELRYHSKQALSRISKNSKQDQGVAIDVLADSYSSAEQWLTHLPARFRLLALDGIQNPQNLGMIIRSAAAGNVDGILLPKQNSAKLSPLVMKASAGTLFKVPILYCESLSEILKPLKDKGVSVYQLSSHADQDLYHTSFAAQTIWVLGNENEGVSEQVAQYCNQSVMIPMHNGVESLNVAMTATLLSFLPSQ